MIQIGEQYNSDSNTIAHFAKNVSESIAQVMESATQINRAMEATSAIIEESTAGTQEIAKGSENASQIAMEINEASGRLAGNAEKLNLLIQKFKI